MIRNTLSFKYSVAVHHINGREEKPKQGENLDQARINKGIW